VPRVIAVVGNAHVLLQGVSVILMSAETAGLGKLSTMSYSLHMFNSGLLLGLEMAVE